MTTSKKAPVGATQETTAKIAKKGETAKENTSILEDMPVPSSCAAADFADRAGLKVRKFTVSESKTVSSEVWAPHEYTWEEFTSRFNLVDIANCTLDEYLSLPKKVKGNKKTDPKDGECFVGAKLIGKRKTKANVDKHTLITLDIDNDTHEGQWEVAEKRLDGLAAIIHTTFKSTRAKPRYRVIIPTTRDMSPDEWETVTRVAGKLSGIPVGDESFRDVQCMYYPRVPKDMHDQYELHVLEGGLLDVDKVLPAAKVFMTENKKQDPGKGKKSSGTDNKKQDPTDIHGVIGYFCKAYTIEKAIKTFLGKIYEPTANPGRYTYKEGSATGGLVCYDHKFAYSNHATDPAGGGEWNAFDLVRVHKFGDKDKDVTDDTPIEERPSHLAMCKWCQKDKRVAKAIQKVKEEEADEDFADADDEWMTKLTRDKHGNVESTARNLTRIAVNDDKLKGIRFDVFKGRYTTTDDCRFRSHAGNEINDASLADISRYLENVYGLHIRAAAMEEKVLTVIQRCRCYHPVKDFIESVEWDGTPRVDTLLIKYLGAADTQLVRAMTRKWMTAAAARIYEPGTKFDYVLTLAGLQGIGKSIFVRTLAGEWFNDTFSFAMDGKSQREALQGKWVIEIAELAGLRKAETEAAKAFISSTEDNYRAAYARLTESHPRQCVFAATTNEDFFLRSITGDRRWWVVDVPGAGCPARWLPDLLKDIPQIWAEARHLYSEHEPLYLDAGLEAEAAAVQRDHNTVQGTGILGELEAWLDIKLPCLWEKKKKVERAKFFLDSFTQTGVALRNTVCVAEIKNEFNNPSVKDMTAQQIGYLMEQISGWTKEKNPKTFDEYGRQRYWSRIVAAEVTPEEEDDDDLF